MGNVVENDPHDDRLIGKTMRGIDNNSTALLIPGEFAKEMEIENSKKVSMSLLDDYRGNRHLVVSKHYSEIVIDYI